MMDEISFARIFRSVIRFRFTFAFLFLASLGLGASVVAFSKEVFQVKSTFDINLRPLESMNLCRNVTQYNNLLLCLDAASLNDLQDMLGSDWKVTNSNEAILQTDAPSAPGEYFTVLERANDVLTQQMAMSAQLDIGVVQNSQLEAVQVSEYAAESFVHASRIISRIKAGEKEFRFETPVVTKVFPIANLVMLLAAVIGLALGLLGVAFRSMSGHSDS